MGRVMTNQLKKKKNVFFLSAIFVHKSVLNAVTLGPQFSVIC